MRIAIIHDWLNQMGGAENVLEVLHQMYPEAPIFTSVYDPAAMPDYFEEWDIRTSFLQSIPLAKRYNQLMLMLYPRAFERMDLSGFDVIISNSSGFCHGVFPPPGARHINYCLTPPRFLWSLPQYLEREQVSGPLRWLLPKLTGRLRKWDEAASGRVDHFIGISRAVVARIMQNYQRKAALIYPPVDTSDLAPVAGSEVDDFFLITSRLVPYKRIDLAVEAFNDLGLPLLIVGDGRDRQALEQKADDNVRFAGRVPRSELVKLLARCRGFIFPGEEDFGIAPLEAQASGRPVIAYEAGGALDTIEEGVSGTFFKEQSVEALVEAVSNFNADDYDPELVRRNAMRFDTGVFKEQFAEFVSARMAENAG